MGILGWIERLLALTAQILTIAIMLRGFRHVHNQMNSRFDEALAAREDLGRRKEIERRDASENS